MIKNYKSFLNTINEANVQNKVTRAELKVGDSVMTRGDWEDVNLDYQVGKILAMKDYGYFLIEFETPFSPKFHAGHEDIGKPKHCFYIPLDNIATNNREEFEKIIKGVADEKKNRGLRLNAEYKEGDVVVGIGEIKAYGKPMKLDGEVGVVYYTVGKGGVNQEDKYEKNNTIYWVGFLDKFHNNLQPDGDRLPSNGAGYGVDKIHLRHATDEEKERVKDRLTNVFKDIEELKKTYKIGDVVVGVGNRDGIALDNNIGIVRTVEGEGGPPKNRRYIVQFLTRFNEYLYDVDYMVGDNTGYRLSKSSLREATKEELEKFKGQIKIIQDEIIDFNHDYKVGEYIITFGEQDGINFDGQIGTVLAIQGQKPRDNFDISFIARFNRSLYKMGKNPDCYKLGRRFLTPTKEDEVKELIRKIEAKEILPFMTSSPLAMLLNRMNVKVKAAFMNMSYFDTIDKNDMISYLPVDKVKRLEDKEDPYKSRLRQIMKIGKFLRVMNKDFTDKEVEALINSYKASYDICISGMSDKLRLVTGEAIRFWYCEDQYVKGGGDLNASCMRYRDKGPEMQMFVENPDVFGLLILTNEDNKLLGRALVFKLALPEGKTFMDYIYPRYEKDREIFLMYAEQRGWYTADSVGARGGGRGNLPGTMVCALNTKKKYQMGVDALDHFDTLNNYNRDQNYLTNNYNCYWKRENPIPEKPKEPIKPGEPIVPATFKEGDKIVYKKDNSVHNNKTGVFVSDRGDGKYRVVFDDGKKFIAIGKNIFPAEKEAK